MPDEKKFSDALFKQYGKYCKMLALRKTTLGGQPAYLYRVRLSIPGYPVIENRQIVCVYQGGGYVFTFTELAALKAKYEPIGDKIIASFRFEH